MLQTSSDNGEGRAIAGTPPLSKYYALIKNFHQSNSVDKFTSFTKLVTVAEEGDLNGTAPVDY